MLPDQQLPDGWPRPRRSFRTVSAAIFIVLVAAFLAVTAVAAAASGDTLPAVTFGAGAVFVGLIAVLAISRLRQLSPPHGPPATAVNDRGEAGLAFPYSRARSYVMTAILGLFTLGAAAAAVRAATIGTSAAWVVAVVAALAAIFMGWIFVIAVRLMPGTIVLTPAGIYHRSLLLEHFVPWEAVTDVLARENPDPRITVKAFPSPNAREHRYTGRFGAFEGQFLPFLVVRAYWLGANTLPAYAALGQYFRNPTERSALGNSATSAER
jgi:hypothetical protein